MFETTFHQVPGLIVPCLALVGASLVSVVWIIAYHWQRMRQIDTETALKQDLLARGLSAADIERILWASSDGSPSPPTAATPETISDNEYYIVEKMLDENRSVEEIERVVRAFKGGETSSAIKTIEKMART